MHLLFKALTSFLLCVAITGCTSAFSKKDNYTQKSSQAVGVDERRATIWDLVRNDQSEQPVKVNRFIWQASLDVLDFLPIQSVDPFSGVIVTGYGTAPGGTKQYRATIYVSDPALDARSLRVALSTKSGAASKETIKGIEDAILTRAREIRKNAGFF